MTTAPTVTPITADIIQRIRFSFGGPEEFWAQIIDAYRAAEPWSWTTPDGGIEVEFDNPDALNAVLDGITADEKPVTAGEAIDDFRLWDFLASEYYWSTREPEGAKTSGSVYHSTVEEGRGRPSRW